MNEKSNLILIHGKNKTKDIVSCTLNTKTNRYEVVFNNGATYPYSIDTVKWDNEPITLDPTQYQISRKGKKFNNIQNIFAFKKNQEFWHIVFNNGEGRTYKKEELQIISSCLNKTIAKDCFSYLRHIALTNEIKNENGELLLKKYYEKISFINQEVALAVYLNPQDNKLRTYKNELLVFPFGGNRSQFEAVRNALCNQISVIQGPPGTGKTQTILNIIANLLIQEKTVEVVSNNNSAIENIFEKLASPKYQLDFLVATLGKNDNKEFFISNQAGKYPDITSWKKTEDEIEELRLQIVECVKRVEGNFEKQEKLAQTKSEIAVLEIERKYFWQYCVENNFIEPQKKPRKKLTSEQVLKIIQECENYLENKNAVSFWYKIKNLILYGVFEWNYYKNDSAVILLYLLRLFYDIKHHELNYTVNVLEQQLKTDNAENAMALLTQYSKEYLCAILFNRYGKLDKREQFCIDDFWQRPQAILDEYPIVLSTTFSSRSSLKDVEYDYIIMDEASQVDIATGALALSVGKNAVIVGDEKQLPNVISEETKKQCKAIFLQYALPDAYSYENNSFLKSVCDVIPNLPQTLLREHYRCHPKIIEFCNKKFYQNQLLIMTEDDFATDTLSVYRTSVGNHRRGHINQRQIDVTTKEVLPKFSGTPSSEVGIITPYRDQVNAFISTLTDNTDIQIDTVHKFQGREKDVIILATVDDEITEFSDNPHLLNVAISRAKKKFCLVTSGQEQSKDRNIQDLIEYIEYNNFDIVDSSIYSVFDLLYQQYTEQRIEYLKKHKRISKYDSENIMYGAIEDLLLGLPEKTFKVANHIPVRLVLRDLSILTEEERCYAQHPNTHLDFLIYNSVTKKPVLAIEVDGFSFHKKGSRQAERDKLKDEILFKYKVPLLRLPTNGSEEIIKIKEFLMCNENAK